MRIAPEWVRRFSLKIVHLCAYAVYSGPLPGALGLAHAQAAAGHDVWFAHDRFRGAFSPFEEVYEERLRPLPGHGAPSKSLALAPKGGPLRFGADWRRLHAFCASEKIDVVHSHLTHDHWLARLSRPPQMALVRSLHSARASRARWGTSWLFRQTDAFVVRHAQELTNLATTISDQHPAARQRIAGGLCTSQWSPLPEQGLSLARKSNKERHAFGIGPDDLLLVHVGLMANRGQRELLCAAEDPRLMAAGHKQVHVVWVGLGPEHEALQERAARSPARARLHFAGYQRAEPLRSLYACADGAFVATPGNDAAVRSALEAMAMGLPVIAPKNSLVTGAVPELDDDTGYLASDITPAGLADALVVFRDDSKRIDKGLRAQRRIREARTFAKEASATLALYEQALAIRRERR